MILSGSNHLCSQLMKIYQKWSHLNNCSYSTKDPTIIINLTSHDITVIMWFANFDIIWFHIRKFVLSWDHFMAFDVKIQITNQISISHITILCNTKWVNTIIRCLLTGFLLCVYLGNCLFSYFVVSETKISGWMWRFKKCTIIFFAIIFLKILLFLENNYTHVRNNMARPLFMILVFNIK